MLVEVPRRKGHEDSFINSGQRKADPIRTLYLETNIDNLRDANTSNTEFLELKVMNAQLLDAIRSVMESLHYPMHPAIDVLSIDAPFEGLFRAQDRLIGMWASPRTSKSGSS